jgi:hypothetical protein
MKLSINLGHGVYQYVANENEAVALATKWQNEHMRRVRGCELDGRWNCIGTEIVRFDGGYANFERCKIIRPVFEYNRGR